MPTAPRRSPNSRGVARLLPQLALIVLRRHCSSLRTLFSRNGFPSHHGEAPFGLRTNPFRKIAFSRLLACSPAVCSAGELAISDAGRTQSALHEIAKRGAGGWCIGGSSPRGCLAELLPLCRRRETGADATSTPSWYPFCANARGRISRPAGRGWQHAGLHQSSEVSALPS